MVEFRKGCSPVPWFLSFVVLLALSQQSHGFMFGVAYTPFRVFGACPTDEEVREDLEMLLLHTRRVRLYSTECENVNRIFFEESTKGRVSLLIGVWIDRRSTDQQEIDTLLALLARYPNADLYGICVGNEALFRGTLQPNEVAGRIVEVKSKVRHLGNTMNIEGLKTVPVFTVEAWPNPVVTAVSDKVGINIHPFFHHDLASSSDPETMADMAVERAWQTLDLMRRLSGKEVIIGEIGWPSVARSTDQHPASNDIAKRFMDKFTQQAPLHGAEYFWFELFDSNWRLIMFQNDANMPDLHFGMYYGDRKTPKW